jgi:hypothetical protein
VPSEADGNALLALGNLKNVCVEATVHIVTLPTKIEALSRPVDVSSKVAICALAFGVHAFTTSLWLIGGILLYAGLTAPPLMLLGFSFLALAWVGLPHLGKPPTNLLSPVEFPELHGTVDRVAQALGTQAPFGLVLDESFGAHVQRVGWRQRKILSLGFPLASILDGDELIALIAHGLAPSAINRLDKRAFVSTARSTLDRWHGLLYRERLWPETDEPALHTPRPGMPLPPRHDLTFLVSGFVANAVLWFLSWIPSLLLRIFVRLTNAKGVDAMQSAADAAGVSSLEAFLHMRAKARLEPTLQVVTKDAVLTGGIPDIVSEFQRRVRDLDRCKLVEQLPDGGPSESIAVVADCPTSYPGGEISTAEYARRRVSLTDLEYAAVRAELKSKNLSMNRKLVNQFGMLLYPSRSD